MRRRDDTDQNDRTDRNSVEELLHAIVQALGGNDVGTDGEEFWFTPEHSNELQVRIGCNRQGRCYDRSANFAISYGGEPTAEPVSIEFRNALERIKAIDHALIVGVAAAFRSASHAVARRFAVVPDQDPQEEQPADRTMSRGDAEGLEVVSPSLIDEQIETVSPQPRCPIGSVVVVGGGTAGYFAALALERAFPDLEVTLIESSRIPIIGVGEATTTLMPPFLHWQLGIDIVELYREVRPTWKLGIKFEWGLPGDYSFVYPFGDGNPAEAYTHDGHIANQSVCSLMMAANRAPILSGDDGQPISLLDRMPFAYHLENKSFVAYLTRLAQRTRIQHIDAQVRDVVTTPDGASVDRLILEDGRAIHSDLYVDASGFRSLLIGKTLGSPFVSYASSLFCDSAVVGEVPQQDIIEPYTTAQTMDAGWCWRIPTEGEDHLGYVFSSAHITEDQARAEMRAKHPQLGDTWTVRFPSGRRREFWRGNTVAVGNAYGFVEPLESTALHMVITEVRCLLHCLCNADGGEWNRTFANRRVGEHWDSLRWFLAVHYKYNRKKDTDFWRTCRATVDVSGIQPLLDRFRRVGPGKGIESSPPMVPDPVFNHDGLVTMLLGQHVQCPSPKTWLSKAQWDARIEECRALISRALTQSEALDLLRRRPDLLQHSTALNSDSWMIPRSPDSEFLKVPGCGGAQTARVTSKRAHGGHPAEQPKKDEMRYGHLLESICSVAGSGSGRDCKDDPLVSPEFGAESNLVSPNTTTRDSSRNGATTDENTSLPVRRCTKPAR